MSSLIDLSHSFTLAHSLTHSRPHQHQHHYHHQSLSPTDSRSPHTTTPIPHSTHPPTPPHLPIHLHTKISLHVVLFATVQKCLSVAISASSVLKLQCLQPWQRISVLFASCHSQMATLPSTSPAATSVMQHACMLSHQARRHRAKS